MNLKLKKYAVFAVSAALLVSLCACGAAETGSDDTANPPETEISDTPSEGATAETLGYAAQMDKNSVMTIEIEADPDEWQAMLDNAIAEEYISCNITINGMTIENVGIRPKGNSSLSSIARDENSDRYSFKIKFDKYVDGQTWLGLDKLVINSGYSDASSLKEYLSFDIMNYIGVDTALYAFADISLNGETWGLYLAIEDYEESYLQRTQNGEGELYKPDSADMGIKNIENFELPEGMELPEDFDPAQMQQGGIFMFNGEKGEMPEWTGGEGEMPEWTGGEGEMSEWGGEDGQMQLVGGGMMGSAGGVSLVYTDDELSSYSSIFDNAKTNPDDEAKARVVQALKNLGEGTNLEEYVDVDAVLRYLAAHTAVVNLDSYSSSLAHNYILYENDGQISILPWDYNMAFGGFMSSDASSVVNFAIDTPVSGVEMEDRPLISQLLSVPEYLEQYHQYLQEILDGYFADFSSRIDELDSLIGSYIENDPTAFYTYEEYEEALAQLKQLGTLRAQSIQGQLDGTVPSTNEGQQQNPDKLIDASTIDLTALGGSSPTIIMGGIVDFDGFQSRGENQTIEGQTPPEASAQPSQPTGN